MKYPLMDSPVLSDSDMQFQNVSIDAEADASESSSSSSQGHGLLLTLTGSSKYDVAITCAFSLFVLGLIVGMALCIRRRRRIRAAASEKKQRQRNRDHLDALMVDLDRNDSIVAEKDRPAKAVASSSSFALVTRPSLAVESKTPVATEVLGRLVSSPSSRSRPQTMSIREGSLRGSVPSVLSPKTMYPPRPSYSSVTLNGHPDHKRQQARQKASAEEVLRTKSVSRKTALNHVPRHFNLQRMQQMQTQSANNMFSADRSRSKNLTIQRSNTFTAFPSSIQRPATVRDRSARASYDP